MRNQFGLAALLVFSIFAANCGYQWQGVGNPWARQGVERIYVETLSNETLRTGVESLFTGALLKEIARGKRLRLVNNIKDADAILSGSVITVESAINSSTTVPAIANKDLDATALDTVVIAADYSAYASVNVQLLRRKDSKVLWSQSFSRSRIYPSGNRFGLPGTTSVLINSSQEQIALTEIAQFIASDAHDMLLEAF
jgi:curli biogenesis system outer membrane secretion channel CsgG